MIHAGGSAVEIVGAARLGVGARVGVAVGLDVHAVNTVETTRQATRTATAFLSMIFSLHYRFCDEIGRRSQATLGRRKPASGVSPSLLVGLAAIGKRQHAPRD